MNPNETQEFVFIINFKMVFVAKNLTQFYN
jgi:hypothetical protein